MPSTRRLPAGTHAEPAERLVQREGKESIEIRVDLLAAEYGGTGKNRRHQTIQDVKARKARGAELAFQLARKVPLSGTLPNGGNNMVTVQVAEVVPFLVMKGMALFDRLKEKDAYDIHFCLQHYPAGIEALVQEFLPWMNHGLVKEGLGKIRTKFATVEAVGPTWAAQFLGMEGEDLEIVRRDAYERVQSWLGALGVVAWDT
jgi:hypothetical protein